MKKHFNNSFFIEYLLILKSATIAIIGVLILIFGFNVHAQSHNVNAFSGSYAQYSIIKNSLGAVEVQDSIAGRDGLLVLASPQRLQFTNINLAFDVSSSASAGGIYRLYQAAFNRTPDLGGLGYWIYKADSGMDATTIASNFISSPEFAALYKINIIDSYASGVNITSLVTNLYLNVLHRTPDAGGLAFYVAQISNHSETVAQVLANIADSPENHLQDLLQTQNGIFYSPWAQVIPAPIPVLNTFNIVGSSYSLPIGKSIQLSALGIYSDGTERFLSPGVNWVSSNQGVVSIGNNGVATGVSVGNCIISANFGVKSNSVQIISVLQSIQSLAVTPVQATIPIGGTIQFVATGAYNNGEKLDISSTAEWVSSQNNVSMVSPGLYKGENIGATVVTATVNGLHGSATLTVTPATLQSISIGLQNQDIFVGNNVQLSITGSYSSGSIQILNTGISWNSSNPSIATINSNGLLAANASGTTTISATVGGINTFIAVIVKSNAPSLKSISIVGSSSILYFANFFQASLIGAYSDGTSRDLTNESIWTSTDSTIATISYGFVRAVGHGQTIITATYGAFSAAIGVNVPNAVIQSISIMPEAPLIGVGGVVQLSLVAKYSDGTSSVIYASPSQNNPSPWSSTGSSLIATVDKTGLITGVSPGITYVNAVLYADQTRIVSTTITVQAVGPTLNSISIAPTPAVVPVGSKLQLTASGSYSNGSIQNLATGVNWASSNTGVFTIDSTGLLQSIATGTATISASYSGRAALFNVSTQ